MLKRTHFCGFLKTSDIKKEVVVCGWVQKRRDLGQLIFIDLRDRSGIIQLAFTDNTDKKILNNASKLRSEYVIAVKGIVKKRETKNLEISTGLIEIEVNQIEILAKSDTPPFEIIKNSNVKEELRLKYRYLDLRRNDIQQKIIERHKIVKIARDYFDYNGFIEIETPILIKSTPEGARDYLVPSRVFPGSFFALPQSPQLYKQLTMLSGFDRYMQIAKCFRDEDLRSDRQPEFTQIDLEMSFVDENDIMNIAEGFIQKIYKDILNTNIKTPFIRLPYSFGLELSNITEHLQETKFNVFSSAIKMGGSVRAINAKGASTKFPRREIDKLSEFVKEYGAKGLAYTKINEDGSFSSSYEKFLSENEILKIRNQLNAQNGDTLFIVASDDDQVVYDSLGALRCLLAKKLDMFLNVILLHILN